MCREIKDRSFAFEKSFCFVASEVWLNEAQCLFYSADVLGHFEKLKYANLFEKNEAFTAVFSADLTSRGFVNWRAQRMLWAYGFENLFKCVIVTRYRQENPAATEVPFSDIKSHNLLGLAQKAGFELDEPQQFYLGILQKCAVWAGRYPLPVNASHMYQQRKGMPTREAVLEKTAETIERHLRGEIPRTSTESDVLHSQMCAEELQVCQGLRQEAIRQAKSLLKKDAASQQDAGADVPSGHD